MNIDDLFIFATATFITITLIQLFLLCVAIMIKKDDLVDTLRIRILITIIIYILYYNLK